MKINCNKKEFMEALFELIESYADEQIASHERVLHEGMDLYSSCSESIGDSYSKLESLLEDEI